MKIVFFSTPKAKQFDYKPRYFDIEKENRERRKKEMGLGGNKDHKSFYRGELKSRWKNYSGGRTENKRYRILIYFIILLVSVYYIFFTDMIQNFVNSLTSR